ncbi:MAG: 2-isopropylmalate synthase [Sedimentisphaerales bacterium]|nr:2-isopropylmalate synthase [Sedimentisphaerales bacterium]
MAPKIATPKYSSPKPIELPDRKWPNNTITTSPQWCSVDLRDGNQALPNPLTPDQKLRYFNLLCDIGFKHIEVAFPSASADDFNFTRRLIEQKLIPDDVFIMGLTQCRSHLIEKTMESLQGIDRAIVHAYYASSDLHLQQVFSMDRPALLKMIVESIAQIRDLAAKMPQSDIRLEFSLEEFTDSDLSFCLEACEAVFETWGQASPEKPLIFNLPATVERRPPNQYADMIEWFCRNFSQRDRIIVSVHSHNDQGMAIAATELAFLAGAQRVEGTLFGHGERTGNVDLVVVANNLYSRGIETGLDFSNLEHIANTVEELTQIPIYSRQPYSGEYVFTAFSGSHQDAIAKGIKKLNQAPDKFGMGWKVPYLHIDPADLGRKYESLIRINSQSGKGGVASVIEQSHGLTLPKAMQAEVRNCIQELSDRVAREVSTDEVYQAFENEFVNPQGPYELKGYWPRPDDNDPTQIHGEIKIVVNGQPVNVVADGNGPISAFVHGMKKINNSDFTIEDYEEQSIGKGADAKAIAYVPLRLPDDVVMFGVGIDTNIVQAAVRAIVAAMNRMMRQDHTKK